MAWADTGTGNTNPVVIVNGSKGTAPIYIYVRARETITLDASETFDPEGDSLSFSWWVQNEVSCPVEISDPSAKVITVTIPDKATGETHIVCEVHDSGDFNLVSYRRVVMRY